MCEENSKPFRYVWFILLHFKMHRYGNHWKIIWRVIQNECVKLVCLDYIFLKMHIGRQVWTYYHCKFHHYSFVSRHSWFDWSRKSLRI